MLDFSIILGITYGGHDSSACLTVGGKLVAACEEERFNRKKHTQEFPTLAINECLKKAGITINDVNEIGFIFDPILIIKEKYLKLALEDERKIQFMINDIERITVAGTHHGTGNGKSLLIYGHPDPEPIAGCREMVSPDPAGSGQQWF